MNPCPICAATMQHSFSAKLLQKYTVDFRQCPNCRFIQSQAPHWLEEAYSDAIAMADTGIVMRNILISQKLAVLLYLGFDGAKSFVDIAGGHGMLTRLMRDYGFDFYWDDKFCANTLARGFEAHNAQTRFSACTAFEVLEHVHDPLAFVRQQLELYACRTLIFTTELYPGDAVPAKDWWYYTFNTGQHISFYSRKTLLAMADSLGLHFYSFHGVHVFTDRKLRNVACLKLATSGRLAPLMARFVGARMDSRIGIDHLMLIKASRGDEKP